MLSPSVEVRFSTVALAWPAPLGRPFGGIDFGYRSPFAALWGVLDRDDVLWITGEHYLREQILGYHAQHLPRHVTWYADPEGPGQIAELRCADFTVRKGDNDVEIGIAAVRARLEDGGLRILQGACPNLLAEAGLYRYGDKKNNDPTNCKSPGTAARRTGSLACRRGQARLPVLRALAICRPVEKKGR